MVPVALIRNVILSTSPPLGREEGALPVFSARLKVFVFEIGNGSIRVVIVEKFNSLTLTSD